MPVLTLVMPVGVNEGEKSFLKLEPVDNRHEPQISCCSNESLRTTEEGAPTTKMSSLFFYH